MSANSSTFDWLQRSEDLGSTAFSSSTVGWFVGFNQSLHRFQAATAVLSESSGVDTFGRVGGTALLLGGHDQTLSTGL